MKPVLHGIPNCDTVRKARSWLDANNIDYRFHDFRKDGVDAELLQPWCAQVGLDTLLNRRGTTWRKLDESVKQNVDTEAALALMVEQPALIKRPVLTHGSQILVGFDEAAWKSLL